MGRWWRIISVTCVTLLAAVLVSGSSATTVRSDATKITIAYGNAAANYTMLFAAKGEGFFDRNGLDASLFLATGSRGNALLQSGSAQFNFDSGQPNLTAIVQGSDTVLLGATNNRFGFKLIARKPISKVSELRGKKLGLSTPNGSVATAGRALLAANGLTGDVQVVYISSITARLAALDAGTVDAIIVSPPVNPLMKTGKYNDVYDLRSLRFLYVGIWAQRDFVKKNPETVRALIRSVTQGMQFLGKPENKQKAMTYLGQATGFSDPAALQEAYDYEIAKIQFEPLIDPIAVQNSNRAVEEEIKKSADISGVYELGALQDVLTYHVAGSAGSRARLTATIDPQGRFRFDLRTAGLGQVTVASLQIGISGPTRTTLCRNCSRRASGTTRVYSAMARALKTGNGYLRLATKEKPRGAVTVRLAAELGQ